MDILNENQQTAVRHHKGSMMVLAGPGSGKTAVITARSAFLSEMGEKSLVITYSKAAAGEMQRRYSGEGGVTFGTFHSAFFRMLRKKYSYSVEEILADGERRIAVKTFLSEKQYEPDEEMLSALLTEMSLVRNELHDLSHYHSKTIGADDFRDLCESYERYKTGREKIDFDDMLCLTYEMLKANPQELNYWRGKFPFIMIDEFQDINRVQYEIVKLLAAPQNNLFIVGDDDQSIYRFRGSRPEFLLNFPKDFPDTAQITLETNYRSTDEIIAYANKTIAPNKARYAKNIQGTGMTRKKSVIFLESFDQNDEAVRIATRIRDLWKKGANLDEIAIAFRLNIQARAFMDAFLNMNIPFRSRDEAPTIYDHWLAEDLFSYLRVAQRLWLRQKTGYDPDAARIINKPFRYVGKAFLQSVKKSNANIFRAYQHTNALHLSTKANIEELNKHLIRLAKLETSEAIRYIRQNVGYNNHIHSTCEYRKLNPDGLMEIASELQEAAKPFPNPLDFIAHAKKAAEAAKHKEQTGPCCTLTTLHSAKGLEFERVFIAGAIEEILPHIRSKTEAEIEEERRLYYVGITRAKRELYVSTVKTRYDNPAEPSRFI
ncbi:MAG: ATP-dependent helicase [Defluviitaleaceae bacterium]|nr:ATP-dependent helicase [Defluviitaleaceae bacterium]